MMEHRNPENSFGITGEPVQNHSEEGYNLAMKSNNTPKSSETTTPAPKAPKPRRLYAKKDSKVLIACHKGSHYVSGETSVFTVEDKVILVGEKGCATVQVSSPDGVREENWNLKGSYTESAPASEKPAKKASNKKSPKTEKVQSVPQDAPSPSSDRIREALERAKARKAAAAQSA